jgi:broad specificity phosphatase PhoE
MQRQDPQFFNNVLRKPHQYHPPNSEGFEPFRQRIIKAWEQLLIRYSGQHVLLVCHGGVIRSLISHTMNTPLSALTRINVPFACLSQICIHHKTGEADWPQLMFHNYSK